MEERRAFYFSIFNDFFFFLTLSTRSTTFSFSLDSADVADPGDRSLKLG